MGNLSTQYPDKINYISLHLTHMISDRGCLPSSLSHAPLSQNTYVYIYIYNIIYIYINPYVNNYKHIIDSALIQNAIFLQRNAGFLNLRWASVAVLAVYSCVMPVWTLSCVQKALNNQHIPSENPVLQKVKEKNKTTRTRTVDKEEKVLDKIFNIL